MALDATKGQVIMPPGTGPAPAEAVGISTADAPMAPYRWVILGLVLAAFGMSIADRLNWATIIPIAVPALKMSMTKAGALMSAFYIGYVITQLPGGFLADRFGPRVVLGTALLLGGLFTMLTATVGSFSSAFVLRLLAGLCAGPIFACAIKYQSGWFARQQRATAMGIFLLGPPLGAMLVNAFLPKLVQQVGWRHAFTAPGLITLVVALLVFLLGKEGALAKQVGRPSKSSGAETATTAVATGKPSGNPLLNPAFIVCCIIGFLVVGTTMGMLTWTLAYLTKGRGLVITTAGAMMTIYSLANMTGTFLSGVISDKLGARRKPVAIVAVLVTAVMVLIVGSNTNLGLFWTLVALTGFAVAFVSPPLNTMVTELVGGPNLGTAMGFYNTVCQIGPMTFPVVLGAVLDTTGGQYIWVYVTLAVAMILSAILLAIVRERPAEA